MKKVLVTGVTGQDGSYMADYLLENTDCLVFGMVRRAAKPDYGNIAKAIKAPRFKLVVGDLSDGQSIDALVKEIKPDYFINLAAQSFVGASWAIPEQTFDVDAVGIIRCLEAIRRHNPACRFYNAGSSEEFGDVQYTPQDMKHPLRARSPYGAAKIAARQIVKVYRESYGLYAVQGLLFNHESERRGEEFVTRKITLGVARIAKAIKEGKSFDPIELGNLDARRDWSHAQDFVEGIWRMLNQDYTNEKLISQYYADRFDTIVFEHFASGQDIRDKVYGTEWYSKYWGSKAKEYLLASGETHSIREFVEKAFGAAGIKGVWWDGISKAPENEEYLLSKDGVLATKAYVRLVRINPAFCRPSDVELLHGDSSLARAELGWTPKVSFNELVKRMVDSDLRAIGI